MQQHGSTWLRYIAEDAASGYGDVAVRLVAGLRRAGARVEFRGWSDTSHGAVPALLPYSRDDRPSDVARHGAPSIVHLVPEYYPLVRDYLDGGPLIAHTVWETDRAPGHWPPLIDIADRVVVPTDWNRSVFAAAGVSVPIDVVPHAARAPIPGDAGAGLGVDDDDFVVYTIGRWDERKAIFHAVRAFLDAFDSDDPVVMIVKTRPRIEMLPVASWGATDPMAWTTGWQVAHLLREYPNPARVRLEVGEWSDERIAGLHTRGDCYVTLSRGEGWGMGAFDATVYGNPVVASDWGGMREYLDPDVVALVRGQPAPVETMHPSFSPDQRWFEPDVVHGAELLQSVFEDRAAATRRAVEHGAWVRREFAPTAVAARFLDVVERAQSNDTA